MRLLRQFGTIPGIALSSTPIMKGKSAGSFLEWTFPDNSLLSYTSSWMKLFPSSTSSLRERLWLMKRISIEPVKFRQGDTLPPHAVAAAKALKYKSDSEIDLSDIPERRDSSTWVCVSDYPSMREAYAAAKAKKLALLASQAQAPPSLDVKAIRTRLALTQDKFARTFALSPEAVRNWETGRRKPEGPARVLLAVIADNPEAVIQALSHASMLPTTPSASAKRGRGRREASA